MDYKITLYSLLTVKGVVEALRFQDLRDTTIFYDIEKDAVDLEKGALSYLKFDGFKSDELILCVDGMLRTKEEIRNKDYQYLDKSDDKVFLTIANELASTGFKLKEADNGLKEASATIEKENTKGVENSIVELKTGAKPYSKKLRTTIVLLLSSNINRNIYRIMVICLDVDLKEKEGKFYDVTDKVKGLVTEKLKEQEALGNFVPKTSMKYNKEVLQIELKGVDKEYSFKDFYDNILWGTIPGTYEGGSGFLINEKGIKEQLNVSPKIRNKKSETFGSVLVSHSLISNTVGEYKKFMSKMNN